MLYISDFIKLLKITDIIDIVIVAIIIYNLLKMIRETRAVQLVKGIVILFLALQLSAWLNLTTMNFILRNTMQIGMFAIVVIFQPELRSMLERLGRSKAGDLIAFNADTENAAARGQSGTPAQRTVLPVRSESTQMYHWIAKVQTKTSHTEKNFCINRQNKDTELLMRTLLKEKKTKRSLSVHAS